MDLVKFVQAIRRHLRIVIAAVVIGAALGAGSAFLGGDNAPVKKTQDYWKAIATVGMNDSDAASLTAFGSVSRVATAATGPDVAAAIAKGSDGLDEATIQSRLGTVADPNLQTVDIIAVSPDQNEAIALADATMAELINYVDQQARESVSQQRADLTTAMQQVRDKRAELDAAALDPNIKGTDRDILDTQRLAYISQYSVLFDRFTNIASLSFTSILSPLRTASATAITPDAYRAFVAKSRLGQNNTQVIQNAPTSNAEGGSSTSSVSVNGPIPRGFLGAIIGLIIGVVIALMLDFYDTRLHTREDFQRSLTAPVLAEVPKMNRREADAETVMVRDAPMSRAAEAFRAIRSSLLFQREEVVHEGRRGFVVMVTSSGPKEGKTTASANLAVAFAEAGYHTLAVNCDFRRPSLRRMFNVQDQPGKVVATGYPRLSIVTNAVADPSANPAQVVALQRAGIEQMRDRYDVIVMDTAPLLTTNDPIDVVSVADLVVLVVRAGQTRREALRQAVEIMDNHRVKIAGVVLVGVTSVPNAYYYYYSSDAAKAAKTAIRDSNQSTRRRGGTPSSRKSAALGAGENGANGNSAGANGAGANGADDEGGVAPQPDTDVFRT
jgi:capsular exopolysaccharide synthesis family protein